MLRFLFRLAARLFVVAPLVFAAARAEDAAPPNIAAMDIKALDSFVELVTAGVGQDALKLRDFANTKSCLELLRAANSFELAYGYLQSAIDNARSRPGNVGLSMMLGITQSRVLTFAARVRAAEFLEKTCQDFTVPADSAADARYRQPAALVDADFTQATIEARTTAETMLAALVTAAKRRDCPRLTSSLRSVSLVVPYLEKLATDLESHPNALGPRASRRGLQATRNQLVAAANQVSAEFMPMCNVVASPNDKPAPPSAPTP